MVHLCMKFPGRSKTYVLKDTPVPQQRCSMGNGRLYSKQKNLEMAYRFMLQQQHAGEPMFTGPLLLVTNFVFPFPTSFPKKKRENPPLPPPCNCANPPKPMWLKDTKPDNSNCLKFYEDISQQIIFENDSKIACHLMNKVYCDIGQQRVELTITEMYGPENQ